MENLIEVKTSTGTIVFLKSRLLYGENRDLKKFTASQVLVDPITGKIGSVPGSFMMDVLDKALAVLLVKVQLTDGTLAPDPIAAINNFDSVDGELVLNKVEELYKAANPSKKNEKTSE